MKSILGAICALMFSISVAKAETFAPQFGFIFEDVEVTLLNEGGKRKVIETMRKDPTAFFRGEIPRVAKGDTCKAEKDGLIMFVGLGEKSDTVRVRYLQVSTNDGACPFGSIFDLNKVMYELALKLYKKSEM